MLSILIPIYNFNVESLVSELVNQCRMSGIQFEILCFDDFSRKKFRKENHGLSGKFGVSYIELSENYGRSKIRNSLAKNARYDYLLFIDCDSKIISPDYIQKYIEVLDPNTVINGGRVYSAKQPRSLKKRLHWKYGSQREAISAEKRDKRGSTSFHSNNFVIPMSVFIKTPFNQDIEGYGYEDVVFASQLESNNVVILNIDNPVEHLGVEQTEEFIKKTDQALKNLVVLDSKSLVDNVKLIKSSKRMNSLKLIPLLMKIYNLLESRILKNLYNKDPNLKLFDFYRLIKFNSIKNIKTEVDNN